MYSQLKLQKNMIFRSLGGHFGFKFHPIQRKFKKIHRLRLSFLGKINHKFSGCHLGFIKELNWYLTLASIYIYRMYIIEY